MWVCVVRPRALGTKAVTGCWLSRERRSTAGGFLSWFETRVAENDTCICMSRSKEFCFTFQGGLDKTWMRMFLLYLVPTWSRYLLELLEFRGVSLGIVERRRYCQSFVFYHWVGVFVFYFESISKYVFTYTFSEF